MRKTRSTRLCLRSVSLATIEAVERRLLMSTYMVNTISDAVNPGTGYLTLRQAVADANAHAGADTITFDPKVFAPSSLHTIDLTQGQIVFTDYSGATTVDGPGQNVLAVNANGHSRVFKISVGVTVGMSGLTITGGSFASPEGLLAAGGGVLDNGNLNLTDVTVSNSSAIGGNEPGFTDIDGGPAQGGGIYSNGTLSLTDSIVSGNTVTGGTTNGYRATGGSARGAGIYSSGSLSVVASTISGNTANGGTSGGYGGGGEANGGAVFDYGPLSIISSTLVNNSASGGSESPLFGPMALGGNASGGAVYTTHSATFTSDIFDNNTANAGGSGADGGAAGQGYGGAILSMAALTISGSTLDGNRAVGGEGPYDDNGPGAAGYGGAIVAEVSLSLANSTISGNSATGGYGNPEATPSAGAYGGGIDSWQSLSITNSTVSGNSVTGGAGGIYGGIGGGADGGGISTGGTATITASSIIGNSATGGAGGLSDGTYAANVGGDAEGAGISVSGSLKLINSTIANNQATGGTGGTGETDGGSPASNGASGGDGLASAIYDDATLTVDDSTITGNTTAGGAGGFADIGYLPGNPGSAGAAVTVVSTPAIFNNTIVSNNKADTSTFDDISGYLSPTSGYNLIGVGGELINGLDGNKIGVNNPQLLPLGWYGGPTETLLPLPNSPEINAGGIGVIPPGVTIDQRGDPRTIGKSVDIGSVEFGNVTITGTVFNDEYASGKRTSGDPGVAGFTIYLDLNHDGVFDAGDELTVTNSAGQYTFDGLFASSYTVGIVAETGYRPTTATSATITAQSGATVTVPAFGETQDALISGTVINSTTGKPLSGWRVYIDLNDDGKWESTEPSVVTSSNGTWSFNIANPGTYEIRIVPMSGYKTTAPTSGFFSFSVGKASARIDNVFSEEPLI
jgi:hypothetical protein